VSVAGEPEARNRRDWDHVLTLVRGRLKADAHLFDVVIETLREAARLAPWELGYTLICEAAVLSAVAGRFEPALAFAEHDLSDTPVCWEAASVYAAIANRQTLDGDEQAAIRTLQEAASKAQSITKIYERADPRPAVLDLFSAIERVGLVRFAPAVASVLDASGQEAFGRWRASAGKEEMSQNADDRLAAASPSALHEEARSGRYAETVEEARNRRNVYAAMATTVAVARIAASHGEPDHCRRALEAGLALLAGYTGEEAYRTLIYHEELRFAAAHGLGMAARRLLRRGVRLEFARDAIALAQKSPDAFEGGALLVAAGEAVLPLLSDEQEGALAAKQLSVEDWDALPEHAIKALLKNIDTYDLFLALHDAPDSLKDHVLDQYGERARRKIRETLLLGPEPDPAALVAARARIHEVMEGMLLDGTLNLTPPEIDLLLWSPLGAGKQSR
jgi:hypothetical protein